MMLCTAYSVSMRTPIGVRRGHMTVYQRPGKISGYLDILNHEEPFTGTVDEEGNCEITGKIVTLIRTICYTATGRITPDSLTLSISDERHVLEITGIPCRS